MEHSIMEHGVPIISLAAVDGLPASFYNGVGVVAVVLFVGITFWRSLTVVPRGQRLPRIVTGHEAQGYLIRAEKAEDNVEKLVTTVAELTAVGKLQKAVIDAAIKTRNNESMSVEVAESVISGETT